MVAQRLFVPGVALTIWGTEQFLGVPVSSAGFTFSYDLSAANGNGMLNLLMFG